MKSGSRRGMGTAIMLIIIGAGIVVAAIALWVVNGRTSDDDAEKAEKQEDATMEKKDDAMMEKDDRDALMQKTNDGAMMGKDEGMMTAHYTGEVLAGTKAQVIHFNKADYDQAVASGRLVVLYFYANWCPICKAEIPEFYAAFNELTTDNVVAFRVNYNDSDTGDDEKALARQYGVAYQHTKVFIKGASPLLKAPDSWKKARYLSEIKSRL